MAKAKIERVNVATLCYLWIEETNKVIIIEDENIEYEFDDKYDAINSSYGNDFVSSYWIKNNILYVFLA